MSERPRPDASGETPPASDKALELQLEEFERELADAWAKSDPPSGGPADRSVMTDEPFRLRCLRISDRGWAEGWQIRPSPQRRAWMNEQPYSYQCLPLVVANQWGWQVLCPTDVRVTWDGSPDRFGLFVEIDPQYAPAIKTRFGQGIVTFSPPWLFRTSPGWDLYVKGPSNRWKSNCVPIEGIIETWWLNYTFTMNWKLVEPGSVEFAKGESIAQLLPVPHGTFLNSVVEEDPIGAEPGAAEELIRWMEERRRIENEAVRTHKRYRKGEDIQGHLVTVPVPELRPMGKPGGGAGEGSAPPG